MDSELPQLTGTTSNLKVVIRTGRTGFGQDRGSNKLNCALNKRIKMHDQLLLQESKGEDGIKKEEMGISQSREDVQASQLEAQMESREVAGGCCSLYWRRWQELCTATPAPAKTCFFRFTAKGLTWLLPERFSASEIGPEAVTAILGIVTAINEHIIDTAPNQMLADPVKPNSFPYSLCISAIKDLETLVEVAAQHYYGDDKKWNFIAVTEATKVLVRLALFRNSGYKMLLHGGETPNIEKHLGFPSSQHNGGGFQKHGARHGSNGQNPWNLEGRALSALSRFGENARMGSDPVWLHGVQHKQAIMEPPSQMIERPSLSMILSEKGVQGALFLMGEVLFITRPLIYVLLIRKYGIRSWIPWFLSLAVDTIGAGFLTQVTKSRDYHLTASEQDELKRRKLLWALYLMRDPFFSKYTRQRLQSTEKLLEPVPIIGLLTAKIVELVAGAQTRSSPYSPGRNDDKQLCFPGNDANFRSQSSFH
ncbi:LOW QUALITY PROTEIN: peroxisome biogenesis protein 16 isoform X1 [Populus alba x Populus x berolinensis]|nr:LOW QUALITY PROTEIN: peroxisome biogenesis protein 16 isoform X1 [Populus alba x Populus x berolinensis]